MGWGKLVALKIGRFLACSIAIAGVPTVAAAAQPRLVNIPPEDAVKSIPEFARQENIQIVAPAGQLLGIKTPAVSGRMDVETALNALIGGTGLEIAQKDRLDDRFAAQNCSQRRCGRRTQLRFWFRSYCPPQIGGGNGHAHSHQW